jgi:hypothetical protein
VGIPLAGFASIQVLVAAPQLSASFWVFLFSSFWTRTEKADYKASLGAF